MGRTGEGSAFSWPSALVIIALIGVIGLVAFALTEPGHEIESRIFVWMSLMSLSSLALGTALGLFCASTATNSNTQELASAREELRRARNQVESKSNALTLAFAHLDPSESRRLEDDPTIKRALGE